METDRESERKWRRANGRKMRTGTGAGTETRAVVETRKGTRMETGNDTEGGGEL